MTNHTATRRLVTSCPGSVRLRLLVLAIATCVLSLTALTGIAGAQTSRRHGSARHHGAHRSRAHKSTTHKSTTHTSTTHTSTTHTSTTHKATHKSTTHKAKHKSTTHAKRRHTHVSSRGIKADVVAGSPACPGEHTRIARASRPEVRHAVRCLLDIQRRKHSLPGLHGNDKLNDSAQLWTNVMVNDRAFSHGADFAARISSVGFDWSQIGENIATGFGTPAGVVRAWMASTGHCENILNPMFREIGIGVDLGDAMPHDGGTWTTDFGLRMNQHAASDNWAAAEGCPYRGA